LILLSSPKYLGLWAWATILVCLFTKMIIDTIHIPHKNWESTENIKKKIKVSLSFNTKRKALGYYDFYKIYFLLGASHTGSSQTLPSAVTCHFKEALLWSSPVSSMVWFHFLSLYDCIEVASHSEHQEAHGNCILDVWNTEVNYKFKGI
jgi:uncharacterized membrane protein